ncbi:hypothetical protein K7432_010050 [Basidiobolus ranarum]|uniref:3-oxo-5-alpha-steroid 4-dehydrogenase C-terminal domain-containing protein n=1 Tax=Basidiobolus ranarum TaxID=34480 RepID=A0ABR2WPC5_9FUNG
MYLLYLVRFGYVLITTSAICASIFPQLRHSILDYGKLNEGKNVSRKYEGTWIDTLRSIQVPKRWFQHFYIFGFIWNLWLILEFISWLSFSKKWFLLNILPKLDTPVEVEFSGSPERALYALLLTQVQLTRRSYEVLFVEKPSTATMHLGHYLVGLCFYLAISLSVWLEAAGNLGVYSTSVPQLSWNPSFIEVMIMLLSTMIFGYFSYRQYRCHVILSNLRAGSSEVKPGPPKYFLPRGDLFEYVTGGHYFGEIMIYFSLWLLVGLSNITMGLGFFWVFINLSIIARETHGWYHSRFPDKYPKNRKIIIPYVY